MTIVTPYHTWHHIVNSLLSPKIKKEKKRNRTIKIENKKDLEKGNEMKKKQVYYLWFWQ